MKKILALTLVLVMCIFSLVSCTDAKAVLEEADAALANDPYKMTLKMNFESDNDELASVFELMNVEVPVTIDGENMMIDMSMEVMGETFETVITLVDKTIYYKMDMMGETMKMKSELSNKQYKEFLEDSGTSMPVKYSDFEEMTLEEKGKKITITCDKISDDALDEIKKLLDDAISELDDVDVDVSDISFKIVLEDKKYDSIELSCTYAMEIEDEEIEVEMSFEATYEYDDVEEITKPSGASKYEEVDFDDLGMF